MGVKARASAGATKRALNALESHLGRIFADAVMSVGSIILEEGREIAPIDTGALKASGIIYRVGRGWNAETIMGFGTKVKGFVDAKGRIKDPRKYAGYQHDDPYNRKYLELAVNFYMNAIPTMIAQQMEIRL